MHIATQKSKRWLCQVRVLCSRRSSSSPFASLCSVISRARAGLVCICHVCVCVCVCVCVYVLVACRGPYSAQRHSNCIVRGPLWICVRRAWSKGTRSSPRSSPPREIREKTAHEEKACAEPGRSRVYVIQYARRIFRRKTTHATRNGGHATALSIDNREISNNLREPTPYGSRYATVRWSLRFCFSFPRCVPLHVHRPTYR